MAVSRVAACLVVAALSQGILGATLPDKGHVMRAERREAEVRALGMNSHGEFVQTSNGTVTIDVAGIVKQASGTDYCDYDYTFGKQNSNDCDNRSITAMSDLTDNECIFAATKSGARTSQQGFEIPQEWETVRPKGCFAFPCGDKWCYNENEKDDGAGDKQLTGYPVCRRWRYVNGTSVAGAAVDDARICPHSEYEVIAGEDACKQASSCLGDCAGDEFRIGTHNASHHDEYPPGCFIHAKDSDDRSCVYWNDPMKGKNHPTIPKGTPICVVKSTDSVSSLGAAAGAAGVETPSDNSE